MITQIVIFVIALSALLLSAKFFTAGAEQIGKFLRLPSFVIGVFIVGIGTSLPELVSAILSVQQGVSEIVPGNVMGANISNILLITGMVAVLNRKEIVLSQPYVFIDLHYLIGAFILFAIIAYDGEMNSAEAMVGVAAFVAYSFYLLKNENAVKEHDKSEREKFPVISLLTLLAAGVGIYFGADYTIYSLSNIASMLHVPPAVVALTLLSLGTTLPELAVNVAAIKQGKAEMAVGNVLGSCIFNSLMVPGVASFFGTIKVPQELLSFSLPLMCVCGLFFYLLSQDKRLSMWEGILFVLLYILFLIKVSGLA